MQEKRGLSAVVTTLLIILLAIVLIGIVWVVIRNVVNQGTEGINVEQFTLDLGIKSAYVDSVDGNVKVSVRRNAGTGELTGIRFIFFNGVDSVSVTQDSSLKESDEQTFSFTSSEVSGMGEGDSVSVAPIFTSSSSGNEQIGGVTDTEQIGTGTSSGGDNPPGGSTPECSDGVDNDNDGNIDLADVGCNDANGLDETNCGDGVCEGGESADTCSLDCLGPVPDSCNGVWDEQDTVDENQCDGADPVVGCILATCLCEQGFTSNGNVGCDVNPNLNTGTVLSIWPNENAVIFFDSGELPTSNLGFYGGKYVNFSGGACTQIGYIQYIPDPGYERSYANIVDTSAVSPSEAYEIWEADICNL